MNFEIKEKILEKIKEYDTIMIFRHIRNDGDCVGATKGLKELLSASFPQKRILLIDCPPAEYLSFMGPEDEDVEEEVYRNALGIVLDTASQDRISNEKYALCRELIKIDHHIPVVNYGDLVWVEEERPSCCEMIVSFYDTFRRELTMTPQAATYLYTGMVTDTGRFRFRGVDGQTLRMGAILLDMGIDTETLYAQLYLEDFNFLKFKAHIYEKMGMTPNGVAYILVDKEMQETFNLTQEQASACVSSLDSIRGCIAWAAFIENTAEQSIRVRLRSRFVTINEIAEKYHGGGHACASGATVYSLEEMQQLLADADAHVKQYKETHGGWL